MYSVIIPNHFEDVIQPLLESLKKYEPDTKVLVIADRHYRTYGHQMIHLEGPFNFSHSVNVGIEATRPNDVILMNDDTELLSPRTFHILEVTSKVVPPIGILSPLIDGGCGNLFMRPTRSDLWEGNKNGLHFCCGRAGDRVTFACVYMNRQFLDEVGPFDENFKHYGFDDADMSIRCVKAGWPLAITNKATVKHGTGGDKFRVIIERFEEFV